MNFYVFFPVQPSDPLGAAPCLLTCSDCACARADLWQCGREILVDVIPLILRNGTMLACILVIWMNLYRYLKQKMMCNENIEAIQFTQFVRYFANDPRHVRSSHATAPPGGVGSARRESIGAPRGEVAQPLPRSRHIASLPFEARELHVSSRLKIKDH